MLCPAPCRGGQITKNCHYISRFLTKPWEWTERRLRYYDFDKDAFEVGNSATLFADNEINTQEVETWLDSVIENPLGACRRRLAAGDPGALTDWKFYRAAMLMLWLQGTRVKAIAHDDARQHLSTLAKRPLEEIDALVVAFREEYELQLVTVPSHEGRFAPLAVPSGGIFPIVCSDTGCLSGHAVGLGLPIDLHCALLAMPNEERGDRELSRILSSLSNFSIGVARARRVVLSPLVLDTFGEDALRKILREQRASNIYLVDSVQEKKQLVVDVFAEFGLRPDPDGAGRLRKPAI